MKYLIVIYNSASFVASLWCLSAITPLLLLVGNDISWISIVAVGLIILYGSSISLFRKEKIAQGCWCKSDAIYCKRLSYSTFKEWLTLCLTYHFIQPSLTFDEVLYCR
ncbi:MAG: hypothetical protein ACI952_002552 [Flavobacteriales bacterium]|jgi:hypothetical protein